MKNISSIRRKYIYQVIVDQIEKMSFNASVEVTEIVLKTVENVSKGLARKCIMECALRHNFNAEEELRILGLDNVTVISKKREKKPVLAKEKSNKKSKKSLIIEAESEEKADLFAELTSDEMLDLNEKDTLKSGEENMSEEKKAQKAQEKAEREAKAEREKAEKAAKAEKRAQEKADRDAKAEQEKAEKEAKAALKSQEKADRDAKTEREKEEKAFKAALKAQDKAEKNAKTEKEVTEKPVETQKITVKRIFYNGTQYLKSSENVLFSPETKQEVGIWCEESQSVLPLPDDYYDTDDEN